MILAIDIDNKETKFGVFDDNKLITSFAITTDKNKSVLELKVLLKLLLEDKEIYLTYISDFIISSVVADLLDKYSEISRKICKKNPISISAGIKTGLNIRCENPKDVGTDRIIRALGARKISAKEIIVVQASSITTIDFINDKNEFLGGAIFPGIDLMEAALHRGSSRLFEVDIKKEYRIIGNNTKTAIQKGLYFSYTKAISGSITQIMNDFNLDVKDTQIILTGTFTRLLDLEYPKILVKEDLGLWGLKHIYELNKDKK